MEWLQGITVVVLLGVCLKLVAGKVSRYECKSNIDMIKIEIKYLKERIDEIKKDTKEILRRNGGERN